MHYTVTVQPQHTLYTVTEPLQVGIGAANQSPRVEAQWAFGALGGNFMCGRVWQSSSA